MTKSKCNLLLFLVLLISTSLFAQRPRGERGFEHPPRLEQMQEELQLSDEQLEQIKAIDEKYDEKRRALLGDFEGDRTERRTAIRELMDARREEIHGVLTQEQLDMLEEKRESRESAREERRAERAQLREALQEYHQGNILPVLKQQREKLEAQISQEDKALIDELRAEQSAMREKMQAAKGDPEKMRALRDEMKAHREEMEQMRGLVEKYEADIERLFTEVIDQRQQWREDLKQIHEQYQPERGERARRHRMEGPPSHRRGREGKPGMDRGMGPGAMSPIGKGQFLLLDPDATDPLPFRGGQLTPQIDTEIFPNPARQSNMVNYQLETAGEVRIELRDNEGRLVKVLLDEYRAAGEHNLEVDLSGLAAGVYYYTISSPDGQVTKKVVVSKN